MNKEQLKQLYLQQLLAQQQNNQYQSSGSSLDKLKGYASKANSLGKGMQSTGDYLSGLNNGVAQKLGSGMSNIGTKLSNGATSANNVLNAPSNYFRGFANRAVGEGLSNIGSSLASNSGAIGTIGNTLANAGANMAGATAGTLGAEAAGTAAGTAAGSAAGGAAAGGSAASGAMAAGPVGALIALGVMALQGTNRKRAKQSGQALLSSTNNASEQGVQGQQQNLQNAQQSTQALQEQADNALSTPLVNAQNADNYSNDLISSENLSNIGDITDNSGVVTGGAANIQNADGTQESFPMTREAFAQSLYNNGWDDETVNAALEGRNLGNKEMDNYITYYNSVAPQDQQLVAQQQQDPTQTGNVTQNQQVKDSLLNKFINGLSDLTQGYQENKNTAFNPQNLKQSQFATGQGQSQALTDYQNQLRDNGYTEDVVNAVAQGKNSGNKDIANWINTNQDALQPTTTYRDKGVMARTGEALGTAARMLGNPTVQGLVAGGLGTALTGNPLYGLGLGYKMANQRAMSDVYQNALKDYGVNVNPSMWGNLTSTDMNALVSPQYKYAANELLQDKLTESQRYHDLMIALNNNKLEETKQHNRATEANGAVTANARTISASKSGTKTGKTAKPQDNKDWGSDLAGFTTIITNPKYANKVGEARTRFIDKYGVDPMKYISL